MYLALNIKIRYQSVSLHNLITEMIYFPFLSFSFLYSMKRLLNMLGLHKQTLCGHLFLIKLYHCQEEAAQGYSGKNTLKSMKAYTML